MSRGRLQEANTQQRTSYTECSNVLHGHIYISYSAAALANMAGSQTLFIVLLSMFSIFIQSIFPSQPSFSISHCFILEKAEVFSSHKLFWTCNYSKIWFSEVVVVSRSKGDFEKHTDSRRKRRHSWPMASFMPTVYIRLVRLTLAWEKQLSAIPTIIDIL